MTSTSLFPGTVRRRIEERRVEGKPLGRHVNHDPRSRGFAVRPRAATAVSRSWQRQTSILDQGSLGSCTGNASAGVLGTDPFYQSVLQAVPYWDFGEPGAVNIYQLTPVMTGPDCSAVTTASRLRQCR